mmetsp:Transcript_43009/g.43730  ORF Transcript_43009/g.43730 Transcript_43009/m.43730 type:complete len:295 (+) Transcript_43009:140-1024(+)
MTMQAGTQFKVLSYFLLLIVQIRSFHFNHGGGEAGGRMAFRIAFAPARKSTSNNYLKETNYCNSFEQEGLERRNFLIDISTTMIATATVAIVFPVRPEIVSANDDSKTIIATGSVKVTPIAHTFIMSSGSIKTVRENDATRYFTNARIVYLFDGKSINGGNNNNNNISVAKEVIELTIKRKTDRGPGVTAGNIETMDVPTSISTTKIVEIVTAKAKLMPDGDILLVGPLPSTGTTSDGKILANTASNLGIFVGGKSGGGVISVLLDGPRENLIIEESGYPTSELLWYSLPSRTK